MIPLRALLRRDSTPVATLIIIALNVFCFLTERMLSPGANILFIEKYAMVPDHLRLTSLITSMFLHGGWLHLIGNMWFLWVFGSHIEDALGSGRYLLLYFSSGIASAVIQLAATLGSPVPTLGASGAIAGIMGAFLVLYPRVRVNTLIFILFFITTLEVPAAFMLVYWFLIQLVSGLTSMTSFVQTQNVAWFAHVGGFIAGVLIVRLFPSQRYRRYGH